MRSVFAFGLSFALVGCGVSGDGDSEPADDAGTDTSTSGDALPTDTTVPTEGGGTDTGVAVDAPEGGVCSGLGRYCGTRLGLDANKLYDCNEGKIVGTIACSGPCIVVKDSEQDLCPCPAGDGRYCGDRVGRDARYLWDCKGGVLTQGPQCGKCTAGSAASDSCAPCASGDGDYCGTTVGGDKNKLYTCKGGVLTVKADCGAACVVKPPGTPDTCPACPSGDGAYCGGPVGLDPNTLFTCKGGVFTVKEKCAATCYVAPPGSPDYCTTAGAGLLCSHVQWWNSALTYGPYMSYGWWDTDISAGSGTPIQLRHDSKLDKEGVYGWGWMPEFTDQVTKQRFRFLHLRPSAKYTTAIGTVYPAGTIVGLSGGDTADTGLGKYSTGAHLCVQTLAEYRTAFPAGKDACK